MALVYFDLGPPLAFNDDWGFAWSARQLIVSHRLHIFPEQSALALVQTIWSALFTLDHPDQRLLRLSIVPFVLLAASCSFWLSRRLGAGRFWSAVASVALLATPLYATSATSFMSDTAYVGLLMAVALTGASWVESGTGKLPCLIWSTLCPLQRQLGVTVPAALAVGLLVARRHRRVGRSEWLFLLAVSAAVGASAMAPALAGIAPPTQPNRLAGLLRLQWVHQLIPLLYLPGMLGLCLLPFAAGLLSRRGAGGRPAAAAPWVSTGLAAVGFAGSIWGLQRKGMIFPGDVWTPVGFTPLVPGDKVPILPAPIFAAIEVAAMLTFVILLVSRRRSWSLQSLGARGVFLLALAAAQFLPLLLLESDVYDRYFLPVAAPLIPLLAALAATGAKSRLARVWALLALAVGLGVYVVGEQDYEAWQVARDQAARLAYQWAAPDTVNAGYEANAVYVEVPLFERTGSVSGGLARSASDPGFPVYGPPHPRLWLAFAGPMDPRPGFGYRSLASGRIVIEGDVPAADGGSG